MQTVGGNSNSFPVLNLLLRDEDEAVRSAETVLPCIRIRGVKLCFGSLKQQSGLSCVAPRPRCVSCRTTAA